MSPRMNPLLHWLGIDRIPVSHGERWLAGIGATIGIACTWGISSYFLSPASSVLMIASMGAGAVLLFAVPHAALSQPWPAIAGNLISALVGVACARWLGDTTLAAAAAVGLAILAMHYTRSLHPPGGATALIAVIGGADIQALGYSYAWTVVLCNALALLGVALIFNNLSAGRRYPAAWARRDAPATSSATRVSAESVRAAMAEMDMVEDISEEDLLAIIVRAEAIADAGSASGEEKT